jgi:molybdopterin-synthase adenylyltransferase
MSADRLSVAMTAEVRAELAAHLLGHQPEEDLCFALWRPSTGLRRRTALVVEPVLPGPGDRSVHGNASFTMGYALRAVEEARQRDLGVAFLHSHPAGHGWQGMSQPDEVAEARLANLVREVTGLPLVGMTLAGGDLAWSARVWDRGRGHDVSSSHCASVRVVGERLEVTFHPTLLPSPRPEESQAATVHAWGDAVQADIARLRVAVVGAGSVGMLIVDALARTGCSSITVLDHDLVEMRNLDRLHGASRVDALLGRPKADVARRLLREASTARLTHHEPLQLSACEPEGMAHLLDADVIVSCVDRPWARHVLNTIAYADLIPVVDGGVRVIARPDGRMRNAYWSTAVARPGQPCLACLGQYDPALVGVERDGSLDDPSYIKGLPSDSPLHARQNVAILSSNSAAALLRHLLALLVAPSGIGDVGPLRYMLVGDLVTAPGTQCMPGCDYQQSSTAGDARLDPTGRHAAAALAREAHLDGLRPRIARWLDRRFVSVRRRLDLVIERLLQ